MHKIKNRNIVIGDIENNPQASFFIIVPTARDPKWADKNIKKLEESCTYPTQILIRDGQGDGGKSGVLNKALKELDVTKYAFYCTIDDDIELPKNWQHEVARAFALLPDYAAFGIDWGATAEGQAYMNENNPRQKVEDVKFMPLRAINIAGAVICARSEAAKAVGEYPIRANDKRKYQVDEDGWRCMRFRQLGWKIGYVTLQCGKPTLLHAPDPEEYLEAKEKDMKSKARW